MEDETDDGRCGFERVVTVVIDRHATGASDVCALMEMLARVWQDRNIEMNVMRCHV